MNNTNRLGCLTGAGFISALITLIVMTGVAIASGGKMFSAGKLNAELGETMGGVNSHAQITECKACHAAPWESETMADRCLACHTDIAQQMLSVAELHGNITNKNPALVCRDCHKDHRGETASLTDLGENEFPHDSLGFSLNGHQQKTNGQPFECADCHGDDVTTFASDSCQTCHREMDLVFTQAHLLSFGDSCIECHDGVDRFGDDFNHNVFQFQLVGGHAEEIACTRCHLDARTLTDLQSAPQDCYSCHWQEDVHNGDNGSDCAACHNPTNWEDANFDHNLSAFPLTGAHTQVECESCHVNDTFKDTPTECVACHAEPQEHAGKFGTECAYCHTTNAWEPASFNGEHTFPMNHGNGDGSCQTCHPSSLETYTCYGCHEHSEANIRAEHLEEGIFDFQDCVKCHADGREHDD